MNEQPIPTPKPQPVPKRKAVLQAIPQKKAVIALAAGAALVWGGMHFLPGKAEMTPAEEAARLAAFQAAPAFPLTAVNLADPRERAAAFQSLNLSQAEAKQLQEDLTQANERLVWLEVFDDCDEDGDIVEIHTAHYHQQIPIFHAPTRVAVALSPEEQGITLTGVRDGGGGITVAVRTNGRAVPLPRLRPGQAVQLPLL